MDIPRVLDLRAILQKKSCFLFGPRQTGKTWLIRRSLADCKFFNLLDHETYLALSHSPKRLEEQITTKDRIVIIDEIQKLPVLLDQVHLLIEERGIHFLLTGSSARKLRRGGVNLLGGRARTRYFHPFVVQELKEEFELMRALNRGLLPSIYFSDEPELDLKSYGGSYLKEEIAAEGLTRNIPAFSRFLQVAASCNGQLINYAGIASDAQVPRTTVIEYFQILRDTLIAFDVPPWRQSVKRKPLSTSKFYFFDVGVVRSLQNRGPIKENSPEMGEMFETFIFHELRSFIDYQGDGELRYWKSTSGFEVDFILNNTSAIEVKAKKNVGVRDLRGLLAIKDEKKLKNYVVVSLEAHPRTVDGVQILPWKEFLIRLWNGDFSD